MTVMMIIATSISAIAAVSIALFTLLQYFISLKKNNNDLFILRYKFFNKLWDAWKTSCTNTEAGRRYHELKEAREKFDSTYRPPPEEEDLAPFALEALFLFGKDIEKHVLSLAHRECEDADAPEDWFVEPFKKYLSLR